MEFYVALIGVLAAISISAFLKLFNYRYIKREKKQCENNLMSFDLLDKNAPYKKYEKISKSKSVSNNPIRQKGNFLDFLISVDDTFSGQIYVENTISKANCGECLDE